jgi:creatinine amidohydrolase
MRTMQSTAAVSLISALCVLTASVDAGQRPAASERARSAPASSIHKLEELTWRQIDGLDRQRTLIILPVGMLEQHGPHLPVGADTIGIMYEVNRVSTRVSQGLPGWHVVMMPAVNYGHGGANLLGDRPIHPGTYAIRQSTLRSLVADLGARIAENGFRWIFVMNGHGAPTHNIALNEASDFVSETYAVTMLHVTGLFQADAAIQSRGEKINARFFSTADLSSFGMDIHAGVSETSGILAIRPDLVRPDYKSLPSQAGHSPEELRTIASAPGWQGYLSSPSRATAAHGRAIEGWWVDGATDLILRAVGGENMFVHPRRPDAVPPAVVPAIEKQLANEAAFDARLENWLAQRNKR